MATRALIRGTLKWVGSSRAPRLQGPQRTSHVAVGEYLELSRTFTDAHVRQFAELGGDDNPVHVDPAFAATTRFGRPIVHGMLFGSLFGTIFGASIEGAVYLSQSLSFKRPVFVGEEVCARVTVKSVRERPHIVVCETVASTESSGTVLTGEATVLLPQPPGLV